MNWPRTLQITQQMLAISLIFATQCVLLPRFLPDSFLFSLTVIMFDRHSALFMKCIRAAAVAAAAASISSIKH